MNRMLARVLGLVVLLLAQPVWAAVILQYHHVSENTPRSTSVTPAEFTQQMEYLADNGFTVVPLETVVQSVRAGEHLAPKTVAITFDDGYQDVADNAHPVLKRLGFAYTVFVNPEPVGRRGMMDWSTLRQLTTEGGTIANHSLRHDHLIRQQDGETSAQWLARIREDLTQTEMIIEVQTDQSVKTLAYPYGEFNQALRQLLDDMGYVGIGQHSGAVGPYSSLTAIPRFPVAGPYADMNSLKVKLNSLNMPVVAIDGGESQLVNRPRPTLTVTLEGDDVRTRDLMCYVQGQGAKAPTWLDERTFSIQADLPLPTGRSRYNCTAPSRKTGNYYWFSQPWVQANADGSWPKE